MGKIRTLSVEKAWQLHDRLQSEAQARFIQWVMKEEGVNWEMAYAICTGGAEPREPEYTLGYKLADPMRVMAMHMQPGQQSRRDAIEVFESGLEPDELELFRKEFADQKTRSLIKAAFKKKKKDP